MYENEYKGNGSFTPGFMTFAVGALVGAGVALLLAPEPGKKMRERLSATAKRVGKGAADIGSDAQSAYAAGKDAFMEERDNRKTTGSTSRP